MSFCSSTPIPSLLILAVEARQGSGIALVGRRLAICAGQHAERVGGRYDDVARDRPHIVLWTHSMKSIGISRTRIFGQLVGCVEVELAVLVDDDVPPARCRNRCVVAKIRLRYSPRGG